MVDENKGGEDTVTVVAEDVADSSLVPMLVGGLVLIVIAMLGALLFV